MGIELTYVKYLNSCILKAKICDIIMLLKILFCKYIKVPSINMLVKFTQFGDMFVKENSQSEWETVVLALRIQQNEREGSPQH